MPETTKLDEQEEDSSDMHEPGPGANASNAHNGSHQSDEAGAHHDDEHVEEAPDAGLSGVPDAEGIGEFAESVISGLEQAAIEIEEHHEPNEQQDEESGPKYPRRSFSGWGTPGGADPVERPRHREHRPLEQQTLSEIAMASGALKAADHPGSVSDASIKHDELADAVQSALFSVYGGASSHTGAPREAGFTHDLTTPVAGWNDGSDHNHILPDDQNLSPQDVILNYFSYDPGGQSGEGGNSEFPQHAAPSMSSQKAASPQSYYASQRQAQWAAAGLKGAAYEGPPSYPVPSEFGETPKLAASRAERESSRLLGAAAIGLVGGIAIAVTLAIFVINSYGPDMRVSPTGAYRSIDNAEIGYGGPGREGAGDPNRSSSTAQTSESSSEIVAADLVAIPGQPTPLAISIKSQHPSEQTLVSISGVPEGGRLNAGVDAGGGNWILSPRRLNGLTVNLPAGAPSTFPLEAQLLDSNARAPLSAKRQFVVRVSSDVTGSASTQSMISNAEASQDSGKSAPSYGFNARTVFAPSSQAATISQTPPQDTGFKTSVVTPPSQQQPASQPGSSPFQASLVPANPAGASPSGAGPERTARRSNSQPEIEDLIREGNKRMREGDILEARQLYQKAVLLGDPEAALAMGRSYDPIYFARIEKKNAEPDAAKAFDWYRRAMDGGASQTAKVRIENLKHFLNE